MENLEEWFINRYQYRILRTIGLPLDLISIISKFALYSDVDVLMYILATLNLDESLSLGLQPHGVSVSVSPYLRFHQEYQNGDISHRITLMARCRAISWNGDQMTIEMFMRKLKTVTHYSKLTVFDQLLRNLRCWGWNMNLI
jgi:hypothetical protein